MGASNEEILFEFEREKYANGEGEDRFVIMCGCLPDQGREPINVKGNALAGDFIPGLTYRVWGRCRAEDKWGKQFEMSSYLLAQPRSRRGSVRYLMQAPGIGESTANALWDAYQSDCVTKLRTSPGACSISIPRLTAKCAEKAAKWLNEQAAIEAVYIDLYNLLDGRGFQRSVYRKAIELWGNRAAEKIRQNPYLLHLRKLPGVGFLRADKLYKELGKNPLRIKRQAMCAHYAISSDTQGNTWFPADRIKSALREHIDSVKKIDAMKALKLSVRGKLLTVHRDEHGSLWIADARKARDEKEIARRIFDRDESKCCAWPSLDSETKLSEHQREQALEAMQGPVAIVGGTPGSGKTTMAAAIVRSWARQYGLSSILPLTPTGKAAVRFSEALHKNHLPIKARTIHSALGLGSSEDEQSGVSDEPMPQSLFVIDEASMLDSSLTAHVFRAFGEGSRMLVIGDICQLPPVGHGAPLRDMINAGLPYGELTKIWRNSGRIVKACKQIKEDGFFDFSPAIDMAAEDPENLLLCEKWKPEEQIAQLEMILNRIKSGGNYDPIWHVQVICAVNAKTGVSRKILNTRLQNLFNPNGERAGDNPFRVKDKIINTKNGWLPPQNIADIDAALLRNGKVFVANGEMGEVTGVAPKYTIVELQSPYRVLRIPRGAAEENDDDEDKTGTGCNFDLGYCVSGHKMQGSQAPIIIPVIDESPNAQRVMSREWIFTALSRAEKMCICIGRKKTIMDCCGRTALAERKTFLTEHLRDAREMFAFS